MDKQFILELIACLPQERTKFYYFKDRFALMLLSYLVGNGATVSELKKTALQKLLQRGTVKSVFADTGRGIIDRNILAHYWPEEGKTFVLTADRWGGGDRSWQQTTRKGYNLVLQLNFSNAHDLVYRRLVKPVCNGVLNYSGHPIFRYRRGRQRETLAWSRMDIDFNTDEVLIEEIQSDWVRHAKVLLKNAERRLSAGDDRVRGWGVGGKAEDLIKYVKDVLMPYVELWDEAMLAASLHFIHEELGIYTVYYHTYETGCRLKKIGGRPPRSLYTSLPKRFCFTETDESPRFLQADRGFKRIIRKVPEPKWYKLDLKEVNYAST